MKAPKKLTPQVQDFCRKIKTQHDPSFIPCRPLQEGGFDDCLNIVPKYALENGGNPIIGWAIWEWPKVMLKAEYHMVLQTPDGELVDIVPRRYPCTQILFLPDPTRVYKGMQVACIRKPLTNIPLVKRLCALESEHFRILNEGALATQHGKLTLIGEPAKRCYEIDAEGAEIIRQLTCKFGAPV